ncbi:universal stress protein [Paucilactobacillus suebicus]|uniref:Universal stress protein UspA family protein n=1 Tax=Paucilactobacillus suebicus DSM 5007 = KCTC 3549 TaxID=1423807 RepID=A0A0R1W7S1_9LACO|nr:universal stress protein [Paucilactobacillus suebicus]KRM13551.1 universal stress protein UspA family protein [Paucilactobacillus suebicus DSM 5007 = KCTC 3549]
MGNSNIDFDVQPMTFKKILVAVDEDDSSSSRKAFCYAVTLANSYKVPLGIVTILETDDLSVYDSLQPDVIEGRRQEMESAVNLYVQKAKDFGVDEVEGFLGEGKPGKKIVRETIPQFEPDLLVCGSETQDKSSIFIGSQASYMSQNAPCSVIVVR